MIEFIDKKGSATNEKSAVVEKLKILMLDRRARKNPFLTLRAVPIMEEGGKNGGKVRFSTLMGLAAATRRDGAPTGTSAEYGNNLSTKEVVLTIDEPLETPDGKLIPTSHSDVVQMDGIDFTPQAAAKTLNILVDGEVKEDVRAITEDAGVRVITYDGEATDKYSQMRFTAHRAIASYYDISEDNATYWTNADVFDYFDAGAYSYEPEEIFIFANPSDIAEMSLELLTGNVSNGDGVYQEAIKGKVPMIAGRPITTSRYVPKGEIWVSPLGVLGAPTADVPYTMIKTSESVKGDLGTYGKHYYNSVLTNPEIFTRIIPEAVLPTLEEKFKKQGKFMKETNIIKNVMSPKERIDMLKEEIKELKSHLKKASEDGKARILKEVESREAIIAKLK